MGIYSNKYGKVNCRPIALDGKFLAPRDTWAAKCQTTGTRKRATINTFYWSQSQVVNFNVRFFVLVNVSLCLRNSTILIKTSRTMTPLHGYYFIIVVYLLLNSSLHFGSVLYYKLSVLNSLINYEKVKEVPQMIDRSIMVDLDISSQLLVLFKP